MIKIPLTQYPTAFGCAHTLTNEDAIDMITKIENFEYSVWNKVGDYRMS